MSPRPFRPSSILLCLPVLVAVILASACADSGSSPDPTLTSPDPTATAPDPTPPPPAGPSFTLGERPDNTVDVPDGQADMEFLEVCKEYPEGVDSPPDVVVDVVVDSHEESGDTSFQETLSDGQCVNVWLHGGQPQDVVTVTENVPDGFTASYVKTVLGSDDSNSSGEGNSASAVVNGQNGALIVFTNTPVEEPEDGEGCTPGYWKNHAGADSHSKGGQKKPSAWEGYSPGDDYDGTFGVTSSFGGTLIEALNRGGGGEIALGRHAVAALLNAAHSGVSYDLSEAEVKALVAAAYGSGDFESAKAELAELNEQGCPL